MTQRSLPGDDWRLIVKDIIAEQSDLTRSIALFRRSEARCRARRLRSSLIRLLLLIAAVALFARAWDLILDAALPAPEFETESAVGIAKGCVRSFLPSSSYMATDGLSNKG